jgi:DUF4097 and DUF4098 domain-containing protein YvlB
MIFNGVDVTIIVSGAHLKIESIVVHFTPTGSIDVAAVIAHNAITAAISVNIRFRAREKLVLQIIAGFIFISWKRRHHACRYNDADLYRNQPRRSNNATPMHPIREIISGMHIFDEPLPRK